jgi:hypothetical protein
MCRYFLKKQNDRGGRGKIKRFTYHENVKAFPSFCLLYGSCSSNEIFREEFNFLVYI